MRACEVAPLARDATGSLRETPAPGRTGYPQARRFAPRAAADADTFPGMRHFQDFLVRRAAWLGLFVSLFSGLSVGTASAADGVWPLTPRPAVVRGFEPPPKPWLPGHRGVDLLGSVGQSVRAASAGTVVYAGPLAGRGIVVISHGATRTTYEPVVPSVHEGDQVLPGDPIATLSAAPSHCAPQTCLHWGLLRDTTYLNPLSLLSSTPVRLLPTTNRDTPPPATGAAPPPADPAPQPPTTGPVAASATDPAAQPPTSDRAGAAPTDQAIQPTASDQSALAPGRDGAAARAASGAVGNRPAGEQAVAASDGAGRVFVGVAALLTIAGGLLIRRH